LQVFSKHLQLVTVFFGVVAFFRMNGWYSPRYSEVNTPSGARYRDALSGRRYGDHDAESVLVEARWQLANAPLKAFE
jgi:hypothetical protein